MNLETQLQLMEPGRPRLVGNYSVEKILNLYKIKGQDQLLTLQEALSLMGEKAQGGSQQRARKSVIYPDVPAEPIYPDSVRALSIGGACGYSLLTGQQDVETRKWKTNFRGLIFIHVSSTTAWDWTYQDRRVSLEQCPKSSIIGAATMTGTDFWGYDENDNPLYEHVLENRLIFKKPILNVKGARNYWSPRADQANEVRAFNIAWKWLQEGYVR